MRYSAEELVAIAQTGFRDIGYPDELLFSNYDFADFLSTGEHQVRQIRLAGFAQQPPSYRTAGFGILVKTIGSSRIADYTALGAPHLFVIDETRGLIQRWRLLSKREPHLVDEIAPDNLVAFIHQAREELGPEGILRAKSLGFYGRSEQIDFYDLGFFPAMEQEVHRKLDQLFGGTVEAAIAAHRYRFERDLSESDYRGLFRLIFRLVAAKLLADRNYPGDWAPADVNQAIHGVEQFYFRSSESETLSLDEYVKQVVWDRIRFGLHLQNLSLEALAYVYENTFVSSETRSVYDTHATPPEVAEFMVRQLPFEDLDPSQRTVFEPFAGHAPFLTAGLSRLRSLLPSGIGIDERHQYLVKMLSGIELDSFAREVARYSLILADYPNPNGWRIEEGNAFTSPAFSDLLGGANIVLCNPPYGDFSTEERHRYAGLRSTNRAVEALMRVLDQPPAMLGFLIPKSFTDGNLYRTVRQRLTETYADISITVLPDSAFRFSQVDTVILLASQRGGDQHRLHRAFIAHNDYAQFWQTGSPTWEFEERPSSRGDSNSLWREPVAASLSQHLRGATTLREVATIHRGLEYTSPVKEHVSEEPRANYARGLQNVSDGLAPYVIQNEKYLDTDPAVMRNKAYLLPWDKEKVIVNAARITRGAWRVLAAVDKSGLVCYQRFHGVWPTGGTPCEVIAAVLNGPIANLLLSAGRARDNRVQDLGDIPLPQMSANQVQRIVRLVKMYTNAMVDPLTSASERVDLMTQIDIEILFAYQLPERILTEIFGFIGAAERPRLECSFVDQLRLRHAHLVDKKYMDGLTDIEVTELARIADFLDAAEANVYSPILNAFAQSKTNERPPRRA